MESTPAALHPDYVFHFDASLGPIVFGNELDATGWLLHRAGQPIHGLRAIRRHGFGSKEIFRGRRKRNRPDAAAVHPDLPDAGASGFLLELQLRLGRNHFTFQVLDHERRWQTFAVGSVIAFPLALLDRVGFGGTRQFLISRLRRRFETRPSPANLTVPSSPARPAGSSPHTRIDLFATSKSNLFMVEIGELVAAGFRDLGCEAQLHLDGVPLETPPAGTLQIVVAPHEYHHLFLTERFSREQAVALTKNVRLLCTEQPETGWFQSSLPWAQCSLGVFDLNPLGVAAWRAQGISAQHFGLGHHPLLAHPDRIPQAERRHDITFLGSMTGRREEFIARHADFFSSRSCHLRLVPLEFAKTEETRSYLNAERRNEFLSQSRILLNLHHSEQKYFEWHRMLLGLANGCCIITETCRGYGRLVPNEHFVMVEPEHLIAACQYYLEHPVERARIAEAGRQFVETELRQSELCEEFLHAVNDCIGPGSIADLLRDQPATPLPADLRRVFSRETRRLLGRTVADDFRKLGKPSTAVSETVSSSNPGSRADLIKRREEYRTRFLTQEETRKCGETVFEIHDNPARKSAPTPALSIVITLYNYAQHIDACLASLTVAAGRLAQAPELVIVNDASTDDSLARAQFCLRNSPLPMRIVDKKFNTGLADARNAGLQTARAPYVFTMDADNLVYPEALGQLFAAITSENADAAYSLLVRFRGDPANRVGLLSSYDWDPQILVQYPYIDAMAMFRRATLLELDGYDNQLNQIGWFGWEDYDMWLKFAQRDLPVAFVPNTLCLYRLHETSMINTTNLFAPEFVHHFMACYGDLLERYEPRATVFNLAREKLAELSASPSAEEKPAQRPADRD